MPSSVCRNLASTVRSSSSEPLTSTCGQQQKKTNRIDVPFHSIGGAFNAKRHQLKNTKKHKPHNKKINKTSPTTTEHNKTKTRRQVRPGASVRKRIGADKHIHNGAYIRGRDGGGAMGGGPGLPSDGCYSTSSISAPLRYGHTLSNKARFFPMGGGWPTAVQPIP